MKRYQGLLVLVAVVTVGCSARVSKRELPPKDPPTKVESNEGGSARQLIDEPLELTLSQAAALTLSRNSELQQFSLGVRIGEARMLQASASPNPELSLAVEDVLGTGAYRGGKGHQSTMMLSQIIELGDKRAARIQLADATSKQLHHEYEVKRVEVLSQLTDTFLRTVADEQLLLLARRGESLAQSALKTIRAQAKAGGASELEHAKATIVASRAKITAEHAAHELAATKRELAAFWGSPVPRFQTASADLFKLHRLPRYEALEERINESLAIRRWATERRIREAEVKIAASKGVPNLTLGAAPRRLGLSEDNSLVVQASIPLPVFDTNQGARQEAVIEREQVNFGETQSRVRLRSTLFRLLQEAIHMQTVLTMMKDEVIPKANLSLTLAHNGYRNGRLSYIDLLDAQRTLLEISRENIDAAYSYHSVINAIERLLGAPLHEDSPAIQ